MMLTLFARVYYVQLLDPHKPVQTAQATHTGTVAIPAPRGLIVDAQGRPLVTDTTVQTITVDRDLLQKRPDKGRAVLGRLAALLRHERCSAEQEDHALRAQGAGAVLDRRAVRAGHRRDQGAHPHDPRDQRAPRAVPRRRRADGDPACLPRRVAGRARARLHQQRHRRRRQGEQDPQRRRHHRRVRPRGAVRRRAARHRRAAERPAQPAGLHRRLRLDGPAHAGRHARHEHRRAASRRWPRVPSPSRSRTRASRASRRRRAAS